MWTDTIYGDTKTPHHYEKAIVQFNLARKSKDAHISGAASYYLSKCYRSDYDCKQDIKYAENLLQEAIGKGYNEASDVDKMIKERMRNI